MQINELRSKPHISVSAINSYINCGLQYKFRRIDKLPPESISDNLVFGSVIHKSLADFNQEKMTGNQLSLKEIQDIFENYWRKEAEDNKFIRYSNGKDFKRLLYEGKNLLETYYRALPKEGFTILSIEEPFAFQIEGIDVPMIGVMDLVEQDSGGTIVITEYKTTSKAYSTEQVERMFQLTIYNMAAKRNGFGNCEIVLKVDSLIKTQNPRLELFYTTRSDGDEKRAIKKIQEVWRGIQNKIFIPNEESRFCSKCEYRGYCDNWAN